MSSWPGAIWYSPVVCHNWESLSIWLSLTDGQQGVTDRYSVADLDVDRTDHPGLDGANLCFHLHGFENHDEITLIHLLARLHQHLEDISGQRGHLRITGSRGNRSSTGCRRRRVT